MAVARRDAIAVVDVDHVAVAARIPAGRGDRAVSRRDDWRAHVVGDIDARVEVRTVPAQAVRRADLTAGRPARRRRDRDRAADERARQRDHARRPHRLLLCLELFLQGEQRGAALLNVLRDIVKGLADVVETRLLCVRATLAIVLAARAVIRQATAVARAVILRRARARHAAQVRLELCELVDLILQRIGLLGELQQLLLLDIVDLAQLMDLCGAVLVSERAVDRIAERADKEQRTGHHRGDAVFEHALRQADALRIAVIVWNQLDRVDRLLLLGLFLLRVFCFLVLCLLSFRRSLGCLV